MTLYTLKLEPADISKRATYKDAGNPLDFQERTGDKQKDQYLEERLLGLRFREVPTGTALPMRYCMGDFADEQTLKEFISTNNEFVNWHNQFPLIDQAQYDNFLTLGLRVAQQLPGRVRDHTLPKYHAARDAIDDQLFGAALSARRTFRSQTIEKLFRGAENIPTEDRTALNHTLAAIRADRDDLLSTLEYIQAHADEDRPLVLRVNIRKQEEPYEKLIGLWDTIPDEAKATYLSLVTHSVRQGRRVVRGREQHRHWTLSCASEFADVVKVCSGVAARHYFTYAQALLDANEQFGRVVMDVRDAAETLTPTQRDTFFSYLLQTRTSGIQYWPLELATLIARKETVSGSESAAQLFAELVAAKDTLGEDSEFYRIIETLTDELNAAE